MKILIIESNGRVARKMEEIASGLRPSFSTFVDVIAPPEHFLRVTQSRKEIEESIERADVVVLDYALGSIPGPDLVWLCRKKVCICTALYYGNEFPLWLGKEQLLYEPEKAERFKELLEIAIMRAEAPAQPA
jgi:hypothetical protein